MQKVTKRTYLHIAFSVAALVLCGPALAAACPKHVTADSWMKVFNRGPKARRHFLARMKVCLPGHPRLQAQVDDLAVDSLQMLGAVGHDEQKPLATFAVGAFRADAEAGFASSQHNYAAVHDARPGGLVQRLVPQNYATFIYWTRRAAAQKEPRALFNLAVRLGDDKPPAGITRDFPTAYMIMTYLEHTYRADTLPPGVMTYIKQERATLAKKLGVKVTRKLDVRWKRFDFSTLAPSAAARPTGTLRSPEGRDVR